MVITKLNPRAFDDARTKEEKLRRLEDHLGLPCRRVPVSAIVLRNNEQGKRLDPGSAEAIEAIALLYALAGRDNFLDFGQEELYATKAFFGKSMEQMDHPLYFMRKPKKAKCTLLSG